jgi:hypothetical protein
MKRTCAAWVAALVVGAALTACTGSAPSASSASASSASAASTADVCQSAADLRTSLAALGNVPVVQQGTDALQQAFGAVKSDVAQLAESARSRYPDQIAQVKSDTAAVQSAVDTAQGDTTAQTLGAVASAVAVLVRDAGSLVDQVSATC